MNICLLTTQVPFIHGGAEVLTHALNAELLRRKFKTEIIALPFQPYPVKNLHTCIDFALSLDLEESCGHKIDKAIGLKFPTYYANHPSMSMWVLHQHRAAYDLWNSDVEPLWKKEGGAELKARIERVDREQLLKAKSIYTISKKVSTRLEHYNQIHSTPLYPPPKDAETFHHQSFGNYLFFPSRIGYLKRQKLVIQALAHCKSDVKVIFAGLPDDPNFFISTKKLAASLGVESRIEWKGFVSHQEKVSLYANAKGVVFTPVDEDLGYITMEAFLSSKAVITSTDSGGPLEFIQDRVNGRVVAPTPEALAEAMDEFWNSPEQQTTWGKAGNEIYRALNISWDNVIERLLQF